jgi:hypothetical protein
MLILLAALLLVIAAVVLTAPWGRPDAGGYSAADIGYVRGGPVGAVLAALGVLYLEGMVQVRARRGGFQRTLLPLPDNAEPLVRAVHSALDTPARLRTIHDRWSVRRAVEASATKVHGDRLRTGDWQRFAGTGAAFAAVIVAVVRFVEGVDTVGIAAVVVSLAVTILLWRGRFVTIAGRRLVAGVRRSTDLDLPAPPARRVLREKELIHADTHLDIHPAVFAYTAAHLGVAVGLGAQLLSRKDWPDELSGGTEFGSAGGYGDSGFNDGVGIGDGSLDSGYSGYSGY